MAERTMNLSHKKILRDDYNIFLNGIQHIHGSSYGKTDLYISMALRHMGKHLLNDEIEHIQDINTRGDTHTKIKTTFIEPKEKE